MVSYDNFTELYQDLARLIQDSGVESSPRGMRVKELLGVQFRLTDPRHRLLYLEERDASLSYTIAEAVWYFLGNNKTDWISNYSKFWSKISDDGETANSAYGARIFIPNQVLESSQSLIQWQYVIDELVRDPDSRRAVIHIRTPHDSLHAEKDVPCTLDMQFFIRDDKLHMVVHMRSSDLILGITYDVPAFTLMQEAMLHSLKEASFEKFSKLGLGDYIHMSNSLHVYERHYDMLDMICSEKADVGPAMPEMPVFIKSVFSALDDVQKLARDSHNPAALADVKHDLLMRWDYWSDWAKILVLHRLGVLIKRYTKRKEYELAGSYAKQRDELANSLVFDGYRRFVR